MVARQQQQQLQQINPGVCVEGRVCFFFRSFQTLHLGHILIASSIMKTGIGLGLGPRLSWGVRLPNVLLASSFSTVNLPLIKHTPACIRTLKEDTQVSPPELVMSFP